MWWWFWLVVFSSNTFESIIKRNKEAQKGETSSIIGSSLLFNVEELESRDRPSFLSFIISASARRRREMCPFESFFKFYSQKNNGDLLCHFFFFFCSKGLWLHLCFSASTLGKRRRRRRKSCDSTAWRSISIIIWGHQKMVLKKKKIFSCSVYKV